MNRMTTHLTFCLLMIAPGAFPQQSTPQTPEDAYTSRELIAWSQLQNPQPTPQPLPPRDAPVPQPEQPQDQHAKLPADPQKQQEPAQSYAGEVIKSGNQYVLQMGDNTKYQLNANGILGVYANQNVKVVGNIDPNARSIRVLKVEPFF
ncbi:MAG: hypothetical protein LAP86_19835 [Acidobacteriia bacterium]|nr:hypothetical protein [Terriglobia bacterium]